MRVLITGGAGYIGSVVGEVLVARGDEVVVYDELSTGHRSAVHPGATFVHGRLEDVERLTQTLRAHRVEAVVHMAAKALVGESVANPALYYAYNVIGGLRLLEAMQAAEVSRIVFSSTAATFGQPESSPIDESAPQLPTNPYGQTKLAFEQAIRWYAPATGLSAVFLRYFNAAGATAERGEDHRPETHIIPRLLQVAAGLEPFATVHGDDYPTPDGSCVRDYVHVLDLADAHVRALDRLTQRPPSTVLAYNLGCGGAGYSVLQVVDAVRRVTGRPLPVHVGARRPGDPAVLVASSARIREELGWSPRVDALEATVESAWRWMLAHPHGYPD